MARGLWDERSGAVEAAAILSLEFSRGTLGTVHVSTRADCRTPIEFIGEGGVFMSDDGLNVEHPINLNLRRDSKVVESEVVSKRRAYA